MNDWTRVLFAAVDGRDADAFASFLADDVRFRFGNAPVVEGRQTVRDVVAGFFGSIEAVCHEVVETLHAGDTVVSRGQATYTRKDGSVLSVPFANVFKLAGGKIREYLIYVDASAL